MVWSDFGNIFVNSSLNKLKFFLCFLSTLENRVIVMIKQTRISALLLFELLDAPAHDVPDMARVLGVMELPGELLRPFEILEVFG